jgi:DNA-binding winged helix-turn-helix (wHTH) protein/Flp pilus assembly protein TadD
LTSEHSSVRLEPKVLAVLLHLIDHRGAVVLHEDLLRDVWKDTHVVPGALARTVSLLRTALGDDAYDPRYIETVPKRGYRLIAAVEEITTARHYAPAVRLLVAAATVILLIVGGQQRYAAHDNGMFRFVHDTRVGNETAFEHYSREVARDPRSADAHAGLAITFVFRSMYFPDRERWSAAAVESANRAVALNAHSAMAARAAGMAHVHAGKYREAERHYRRALALNPNDHATPLNLGWLLSTTGQPEAAIELIRKRLAVMPDSNAYGYLAEALWLAGRLSEATAAARTAVEFEPFARDPQLLLARHELVSGDHAAAGARLERLLAAHPDCAQCVLQLGLIEQQAGNVGAAEARYRDAVARSAPFVPARLRLAHLLWETNRREEAATLLRSIEQSSTQAIDAGSEMWWPQWNLAVVAAIRGDRVQARSWFREAVRMGRRDAAWDAFEPMLSSIRPLPLDSVAGTR